MERPIKELTEDEVKEYRIIKAALDAGATVKKAPEGEGGVFLRGRKLSTEEVMDCIFNPDFKTAMTYADHIRAMSDEEMAEFWGVEKAFCPPEKTVLSCLDEDMKIVHKYPDGCINCWLDWLKGEADEDQT